MDRQSIEIFPYRIFSLLNRLLRKKEENDPSVQFWEHHTGQLRSIQDAKVLEIGSRNVSGPVRRDMFPNAVEYVGIDVREGENVDVVGDVHELSKLVPNNHFDIVYSISVFEHLLFPWKAALEINKALKPGGHVMTATHPA